MPGHCLKPGGNQRISQGKPTSPVPLWPGSFELCLRVVPMDYGMSQARCVGTIMSCRGGWRLLGPRRAPVRARASPGLLHNGSCSRPLFPPAPLHKRRGDGESREEPALGFPPGIPFLPVTDRYSPQRQPGRASAVPGPAGRAWADAPRGRRWVSMPRGARGSRAGRWAQHPAQGVFPSEEAGAPGVSHPTARG